MQLQAFAIEQLYRYSIRNSNFGSVRIYRDLGGTLSSIERQALACFNIPNGDFIPPVSNTTKNSRD